ncbi:MaoC family dehydratase [Pseudaquidulcibacter saccharophilus]|uniref:MaoC family dehydratase n=1 Tax=Pseudaquidulcibacter saccharophilus TaxID=2831900 RepID=UPI001EFEF802|nr:hypothetical protein [Pseudaquidulcibacter saccharophilus]
MAILPRTPDWYFEDIIVGRSYDFGAEEITADDIALIHEKFAPDLPNKASEKGLEHRGPRAAESHVYAVWRKMLFDETRSWPIVKRLAQDNLRFYRSCYAGDKLHVRLTFLSLEDRTGDEGVLVASNEVLDEDELLVMSVLTRSLIAKRPKNP